jgi:hypothetical protein
MPLLVVAGSSSKKTGKNPLTKETQRRRRNLVLARDEGYFMKETVLTARHMRQHQCRRIVHCCLEHGLRMLVGLANLCLPKIKLDFLLK